MTQPMKLSDLIAETFQSDEMPHVVLCDASNGCGFGEIGQMVEYDAANHADLMMTPTLPHISNDHCECVWASDWIDGDNGYRWQVRF